MSPDNFGIEWPCLSYQFLPCVMAISTRYCFQILIHAFKVSFTIVTRCSGLQPNRFKHLGS